MTQETELEALLRDMRVQVAWTDEARMPIPLYERVKAFISSASFGKGDAKAVEVGELETLIEPHISDSVYSDQGDICGQWDAAKSAAQAILSRYNVTKKEEV